MLTYQPGGTVGHALDPRSKLCFQVGFAVAAFTHLRPPALVALSGVAVLSLAATGLSPVTVLRSYPLLVGILLLAPLSAGVVVGPPWFAVGRTVRPALSSYRVLLVLAVSGAYVRSTPVRASRAAVQRHVPGRAGQLLGVGMGLTLRFLPVLQSDLRRVRTAMAARLGDRRSVFDRARRIGLLGLGRSFERADRLALALRARCFAWNPTLPTLRFSWLDYPVAVAGVLLGASPLV